MGTVLSIISGTPLGVGDAGDALDVEDVVLRVGDRLAEEALGVVADGRPPLLEVVGVVDERDLDAHLRQRVVEQVVRAAVQRRRRHDVVAGLGEVEDGQRLGRLAGADTSVPGRPTAVVTPPSSELIRASSTPWVGFMIRV